MIKILFVCMGNICRSPAAEGILRDKLQKLGKTEGKDFAIDSAATSGYHRGTEPDLRSQEVMKKHGLDISSQISRMLTPEDGDKFDLILCMDERNLSEIKRILNTKYHDKVRLLGTSEIEDPYSRDDGFEAMYEHIDMATDRLISELFAE